MKIDQFADYMNKPIVIRRFNGWASLVWIALVPVTIIYLPNSILWVAFLSVWANFATHYGTWLTARVEVREETVEGRLDVKADMDDSGNGHLDVEGELTVTDEQV